MDEQAITVQLTDSELAHAAQVAHADQVADHLRAAAAQRADRYARPEEREQLGHRINPTTAAVFFRYALTLDPYGDGLELPEHQVGREFFVVDPDERIAVSFHDLPEATRAALYEKRAAANRDGWRLVLGSGYPRPRPRPDQSYRVGVRWILAAYTRGSRVPRRLRSLIRAWVKRAE